DPRGVVDDSPSLRRDGRRRGGSERPALAAAAGVHLAEQLDLLELELVAVQLRPLAVAPRSSAPARGARRSPASSPARPRSAASRRAGRRSARGRGGLSPWGGERGGEGGGDGEERARERTSREHPPTVRSAPIRPDLPIGGTGLRRRSLLGQPAQVLAAV